MTTISEVLDRLEKKRMALIPSDSALLQVDHVHALISVARAADEHVTNGMGSPQLSEALEALQKIKL